MKSHLRTQQAKRTRLLKLEPRILFDGAAVADILTVDATLSPDPLSGTSATDSPAAPAEQTFVQDNSTDKTTTDTVAPAEKTATTELFQSDSTSPAVTDSITQASAAIRDFIANADDQTLFNLFNGGETEPSAEWLSRLDALRTQIADGSMTLSIVEMDSASTSTAIAAYTHAGPDGQPTIFINRYWFDLFAGNDATRALVEEFGHAIDDYLNPNADTAGDEGEAFSGRVMADVFGAPTNTSEIQSDAGRVTVNGINYDVEFASFNFVNAYEMVYDLNGDGSVVGSTGETDAAKEQNSHNFDFANPLGVVKVNDQTGNQNFSGNDVSATSIVIGGVTYNGWISRPIKSGGIVRGFYFWTDADFVDRDGHTGLYWAQQDGNTDGDSNTADNRGFVLVVDQAWFTTQISNTTTAVSGAGQTDINGRTLPSSYANVGSSSDRVDSALNSLLTPNAAPTPVNDSLTVLEDSVGNTGNVLTNDTDPNRDTLTVTGFSINGVAGAMSVENLITGIGKFTLNTDGSYIFTPDPNYAGPVPAITYTVSDGSLTGAATLSIAITPVNDAPTGTDKTLTVRESLPYTFTSADFGFTDPLDSPANSLASVIIKTLPSNGTLKLNGVAVTTGQEITAADLTKLQFTSDTSGNGTSFTFQVRDNGGTANGGVDLDQSPNTITINVSNVNHAPTAAADTVTAVEAGGVSNGTAGTNPTGNVLANDTDTDSGDTKTVTAVSGTLAGTVGSATYGSYGALTLNADGSYSYVVDNNNAAVQALRLSANTLTDTFTYTMADAGGLTSSSTLTITIEGANDAPVANPDFNSATISTTAANTATGNVLTNDTDVDANSESKSIVGLEATGQYVSFAAGGTSTTLTFAGNGGFKPSLDDYLYTGNDTSKNYLTYDSSNNLIRVTSIVTNANGDYVVGFSGEVHHYSGGTSYTIANGGTVGFYATTAKDNANLPASSVGTVGNSSTTISSTVTLNGISGNIVVGMTASDIGGNIPAGATVTKVVTSGGNTVVTLDKNVTTAPTGTITFTATAGSTVNGTYGSLKLNSDGSYIYTTYIDANASGKSGVDVFSYKMQDDATNSPRLTSSSTLTINVAGPSLVVTAVADSKTINEDASITDNVLTNDTASSGTKAVTGFTWNGQVGTLGTPMTLTGIGTLTLSSTGAYTFTPASNYSGSVPVVSYTMTNGTYSAASTLTITITPANDNPVANADTVSAKEAGGYANATLGINPSGNVLSNDTDVDGDSLTVSAITGGTVGSAKAGTYGSLTLNSNGTYTYTVDNNNATVQALNVGGTLTDTFTYTVSDGHGGTDTATLTVTINGADDAPANTLPGTSLTAAFETSTPISGVSIADVDNTTGMTTQLTVSNGVINFGNLNGAMISSGANGSATLTLSGSVAQINLALATLSYTGATNFSGTDVLTVQTTDPAELVDIDVLPITVSADSRIANVTGTTVNEASPYVMFEVSGATGQKLTLSLANGTATSGLDFLANLEYFDGTNWVAYTGVSVTMPGATMLVRTPVLQDTLNEGSETLTLTAINMAGTAGTAGTSSIRDDAQGAIYLPGNNTFTANNSGDSGYPTYLDDDRPVTVNSITVNEASPKAVLTVSGAINQVIQLQWVDGTAKVSGATPPSDGTPDYGPGMEINNGSGWVAYTPGNDITLAGSTLYVRTTLVNDTPFEGQEAFYLKVTKQSSGAITTGTVNIYDDGTGSVYLESNTNGTPDTSGTGYPASLDDDRTISVNSLTINEASNYTVFTVTGNSGQTASLQLINESSGGTIAGKANVNASQTLKIWDGLSWVDYNSNNLPTFDANGKFYVRVDITAEQDIPYEGAEAFKLNATLTGQSSAVSGTGTIIDDGTGVKFPGTFIGGIPDTETTGLDDDRTISVTGYGPVNEGSTYAMFTVDAIEGYGLDLSLQNASSGTAATWSGFTTIEYSTDGTSWTTYSGGSKPTVPAGGKVYVRVDITSESDTTYEGAETFALKANYTTNTGKSASGDTSIIDNGTGTKYGPNMPSGTPATNTTSLDDDRTISVTGYGPVNEGSTYAMFTVDAIAGYQLDLSLQNASAGNAATWSGFTTIQYSTDGTNWTTYSGGSKPTVPAGGKVYVRVDITSESDTTYEGAETFALKANYTTNTGKSASGDTSIIDNGSGTKYGPNMPSGTPATDTTSLDDDRSGSADLSIVKSVNVSTPSLNGEVIYTLTVHNAGPDTALSTIATDRLPGGLSFVSASTSANFSSTTSAYNASTGEWTIGDLASGSSATLYIKAQVNTYSPITNQASVTSNTGDPNMGNNTDAGTDGNQTVDVADPIVTPPPPPPAEVVTTPLVTVQQTTEPTQFVLPAVNEVQNSSGPSSSLQQADSFVNQLLAAAQGTDPGLHVLPAVAGVQSDILSVANRVSAVVGDSFSSNAILSTLGDSLSAPTAGEIPQDAPIAGNQRANPTGVDASPAPANKDNDGESNSEKERKKLKDGEQQPDVQAVRKPARESQKVAHRNFAQQLRAAANQNSVLHMAAQLRAATESNRAA